jgi:endonuclease G
MSTISFSQKLRDSVYIKSDIFEIVYSEKLEQPLWIRYKVLCPTGTAPRTGMDFFIVDSVKTSDNKDYEHNPYDKGHLAPAADFNCTKEMLFKTFTYLNCTLQQENLNRTTWRLLESHERELAKTTTVEVVIKCNFSKKSLVLPSGATVPDSYIKTIYYSDKKEIYFFKNEKPYSTDFKRFLLKK